MQTKNVKWLAGSVAFFLPTITTFVATQILNESFGEALMVSMTVAAIIPPAIVLSTQIKWRLLYALGLWLLLALQFCLILVALMAGFRS
jgi:hypothetical protein